MESTPILFQMISMVKDNLLPNWLPGSVAGSLAEKDFLKFQANEGLTGNKLDRTISTLKAGWWNQPQFFSTWKVRSETSHWIHLGFPISIPGTRNLLQSQEVFLMYAISNFFNFEDREEHYTSNCMYFERQIHWCTQKYLLTSSSIHQESSIRNISVLILSVHIHSFWSFITLIYLSWMEESTWILF